MQRDNLRIAMVGLGGRGFSIMTRELLSMDDVDVTAVCDIFPDRVKRGSDAVKEARGHLPFETTDYRDILTRDDVDAFVIDCAWERHIQIAVAALRAGKKVAMEVGGAYSIKDCWDLVEAVEQTKGQFMFLENCCYDEYEMMVFNMVRQGIFGDIVHCRGGYEHDLREEVATGRQERHYRLRNYICRNCDNYPTHDLGPISKIMRVNRGNLMLRLNSVSSKAAGLHEYICHAMPDDPLKDQVFMQGDTVNTMITCADGATIELTLQTTLPRYYSRDFTVMGTKGMYCELNNTVFIDGVHNEQDMHGDKLWDNGKNYLEKYRSPLWQNTEELRNHGHGGMDAITLRAMVECFEHETVPPIDVYDGAAWMAISTLSEQSIKLNGAPVEIPDFTRGAWKHRSDKAEGKFSLEF